MEGISIVYNVNRLPSINFEGPEGMRDDTCTEIGFLRF
jgi:hypothetical protein